MNHISHSQYVKFSTCPHKWALEYIKGQKEPPNINLVFGTAMHVTLQHWLTLYYTEPKAQWQYFDLPEFFKQELVSGVTDILIPDQLTTPEEMGQYYLEGCEILAYFKQHVTTWFPFGGHQLIGTEIPLLTVIQPNLEFKGFIDLILHNTNTGIHTLFDFKTSKSGWGAYHRKDTKKTDQLLFYKHFYSQVQNVPLDKINIHYLILKRQLSGYSSYEKRIGTFEPAHGSTSIQGALQRLHGFTSMFDEEGLPDINRLNPTPSLSNCRFCPFLDQHDLCAVGIHG